ncbi:copper homeostasis protein CutC [Clostridium sp.]|uniref:copper homeostasis protein CutC n=1 Tax=Clostridium sp. TaxID=1506 RepID=UPI00346497A4
MDIFESCVGSYEEAKKAERLGAHRIELCDNLIEGGTTPSYGTISMACENLDIPIMVIIRPRGGDFLYTEEEIEIMKRDIKMCKELGVYGVVLGVLNGDKKIDKNLLKNLIELSKPLKVTFHMAFDEIEDKEAALQELINLNVDRILTKGGIEDAFKGKNVIKSLIEKSEGKIIILPGGGVTKENYEELKIYTGAKEFHGKRIVGKL